MSVAGTVAIGKYNAAQDAALVVTLSGMGAAAAGTVWSNTTTGTIRYWDGATAKTLNATTLPNGQIWIGDGTGIAQPVTISGDATISNTGVVTIANNAITSAKINDGAIANADINAAANIDATKLGTGVVDNTEFNYLNGVTSAIQTQIDNLSTSNSAKVAKAGDTMTGDLTMDNEKGTLYREATGNGTNKATVKAPAALAADYTLTLPTTDGNANEVLTTDGNGVLSWATSLTTSLASGNILVGNAGGVATAVSMSGDATMDNAGAVTIANSAITNAKVSATANIDATKLGTGVVDNTEFNYLNGVTSAIQTQIDAKVAKAGDTMTGDLTMDNQKAIIMRELTANGVNTATIQVPAAHSASH
jgi:hypothetical protein